MSTVQQQQRSSSVPPSPPLIWFLLLDSASGKPYKDTSVSSVLPSSLVVPVVDHFRKAVKAEYSNKLSSVDSGTLLVYKNRAAFEKRNAAVDDGEKEPMEPTESLDLLGSKEDMLVVAVPSSTSSLKPFRQKRYKAMSVEASCRKYLDAIALKLASFYEFDYKYDSGPTIGDVFAAKDGVEGDGWSFRRAKKNYQQIGADGFTVEIRKGQPLASIKLPDIYTTEEWEKIKKFNYKTSERIHSGSMPSLSNGRPYIVIPHAEFTPEMIYFLKTIGVKASLFSNIDVLEIKDKDVLSEGSSSVE
ncbi:hypothetical protein ACHAW6_015145 [Cyclotella cf. meneghiniana]